MRRAGTVVLALAALGAACVATPPDRVRPPIAGARARPATLPESAPGGGSNILGGDYAGSAACTACHAEIAASFERSPMHRMTRLPTAVPIEPPFDGATFHFKDDTATLLRRGSDRLVRLDRKDRSSELYRVTRVIGGRTREDFVGVRLASETDTRKDGEELVLPVSYLLFSGTLRYKGYSVMVHERPRLEAGPVWSRTCIFCHNTVPYFSVLLGGLAGGRARGYQGEVVDDLLPSDRAWTYAAPGTEGLGRALRDEMARLGAPLPDADLAPDRLLRAAIDATRSRFDGSHLLEVGIGCESCHGGARAHAEEPTVVPAFEPRAPFLGVRTPNRETSRASQINHVCARCHQVLFSRYPFTWEGGRRHTLPGGSHISSGEGHDFLLGGCAGAMACSDCHDPHQGGGPALAKRFDGAEGNTICLRCHTELADERTRRAHSHHAPDGPAGACVACHMPKKNMGLDNRLTRYHRLGSPTDPLLVLGDRPLECALCHVDKSVAWTVSAMERLWQKSYDRKALEALYGDLESNVLSATLVRGKPHEQAVAMSLLGDQGKRAAAPLIAKVGLLHTYPLVREVAKKALVAALGRPCDVHLYEGDARIMLDGEACLRASGEAPLPWPPSNSEPYDAAEQPED